MTAAISRSAGIRSKLLYIRGHRFSGRAARFRSRQCQSAPEADFEYVASLPDWVLCDRDRQMQIGLGAAILKQRRAIERELSGGRLTAIAALVGSEVFEQLCDYPLPDLDDDNGGERIARPEDFAVMGAELLRSAMPCALRDANVSDSDAATAQMLCGIAARLIDPPEPIQ